jgi:hypothetical protein
VWIYLIRRYLVEMEKRGTTKEFCNLLIVKDFLYSLSALECAKCELFAKSSDIIEKKEDGG